MRATPGKGPRSQDSPWTVPRRDDRRSTSSWSADDVLLASEVTLSAAVGDRDARHLHRLRDRLGDDLLDAAVLTTGPEACRRKDGIAVVPLVRIGP